MPVKQKRIALSEEERAERRRADREYARQAVERLRSSHGWQRWLATRRHFHSYSLGNQLLIAMVRPTATRVAGFRSWLELGYAVRKRPDDVEEGHWAIRIWAPCPPSRKQIERWQKAGADPNERPRTFYKLVPVFAQDQVDPLPPPAEPAPLDPPIRDVEGDELAPVIPRLTTLGSEIGSTVAFSRFAVTLMATTSRRRNGSSSTRGSPATRRSRRSATSWLTRWCATIATTTTPSSITPARSSSPSRSHSHASARSASRASTTRSRTSPRGPRAPIWRSSSARRR